MGPAPDMDTMDDVDDDVNDSNIGSDITLPDSLYEEMRTKESHLMMMQAEAETARLLEMLLSAG